MLNLYNGAGMGSAGTGIGGGGSVASNALSPQLMAMLSALHQGGGTPAASGASVAPTMTSPLSAYLGASGNPQGAQMHAPMPSPVGAIPGMQGAGPTPQNQMNSTLQTMLLLQKLKGAQNGVAPSGTASGPVGMASQLGGTSSPSMLSGLLNGGGLGGLLSGLFGHGGS